MVTRSAAPRSPPPKVNGPDTPCGGMFGCSSPCGVVVGFRG